MHVALPQKIVHACLANGVGQVVHISALGADSLQPTLAPSMYLRTKGEGEAVLVQAAMGGSAGDAEQVGFDLSILRPSVIFGDERQIFEHVCQAAKGAADGAAGGCRRQVSAGVGAGRGHRGGALPGRCQRRSPHRA